MRPQPLAQRMRQHQRLEFTEHLTMPATGELGFDAVLGGTKTQLFQPRSLRSSEPGRRDVGKRWSTPHRKCRSQQVNSSLRLTGVEGLATIRSDAFEPDCVDAVVVHVQPITL